MPPNQNEVTVLACTMLGVCIGALRRNQVTKEEIFGLVTLAYNQSEEIAQEFTKILELKVPHDS